MVQAVKLYLPLVVIFSLCVFGLFAPIVYKDIYSEIINNSPTLYMPMVSNEVTSEQHCSDPTKLHYIPCGLDTLTSHA